jgi:pimeloyl-ACP methyl ester carboxylesterase
MSRSRRAALLLAVPVLLIAAVLLGARLSVRGRERLERRSAAPAGGRFVRAGDVELHIQESGQAAAPALVFLHGAGGWSQSWRSALDACPARGYRCIALDLPPLGYSERPASRDYSIPAQAKRVVALLDALKLDRVVLVGHSFGGRTSVETALAAPGRVKALILVDPALSLGAAAGAEPPLPIRLLLGSRRLRALLCGLALTNPRMSRRLLSTFMADPASATPELVAMFQRPLSLKGTTRAYADWLPSLISTVGKPLSADRASVSKLAVPTFLIWGEKDTTTPLSQAKDFQTLVPAARLETIPGVGHMAPLEAPARVQELLFSFADGLK